MINSVRNTVLSVLNKNNYGYISPSDFNLYAMQAQIELYEEYFSSYNKTVNMENQRLSGTDYADMGQPIVEALEIFIVNDFLYPVFNGIGTAINQFFTPSLVTTGNDFYMINKMVCYTSLLSSGVQDTITTPFALTVPSPGNFITNGVSVGDIVLNTTTHQNAFVSSIVSEETITLTEDIFQGVSQGYAVYSSTSYSEAEKVSNGKITMLNMSMLTSPSLQFPAYVMNDSVVSTYPASLSGYGAVRATYFRYPKPPKWTFVTLVNGEPSFDQSQPDYQDFEMPIEDEYKLIMKILQYCGMSIREIQVTQFGIAQEQQGQPSFGQQ
jgi:hypothetical protein